MTEKHDFRNFIATLSGILLCLTLITSHLTAGMYARFISTDSAADTARVAAFRVTEAGQLISSFAAELTPGNPCIVPIHVNNESEVAISYSIAIVNTSKTLPLTFLFGKAGGTRSPMAQEDGRFTYTDYINPNSASSYDLELYWVPSSTSAEDLAYMGYVDMITITLTATQID